jgi:signal transduction histidine kinase
MLTTELKTTGSRAERERVEAVVETLATVRNTGNSLAELAHDARNMVTALSLYCDLLEEPGILVPAFFHYGSELRLVVAANRRLVEKLVLLDTREAAESDMIDRAGPQSAFCERAFNAGAPVLTGTVFGHATMRMPNDPIQDMREELLENRNLLDAMAGFSIGVTVEANGGRFPVNLTSEDLTRILVNLVKNASESMRTAGTIRIALSERNEGLAEMPRLLLTVEDSGPGIPKELREKIFMPGFTTRASRAEDANKPGTEWPFDHRGLGLSITRSIVEAAGGHISAGCSQRGGALFEIELPARRA